ncbi:DUF1269 domain-containing protein [Aeromicrobium senzhongii]|uniref:DUF1269 domain-containing protein n=1 Tax=Aeromicrobium senzhongii TaxID=2663859 RepID=A0ABX6SZ96_9ACTN|nr:DUF1269 domain-containing protein [Aeromicrobium senzhongii]MTB87150.1 DUF1269 domain-containing protein [Aeromicrobium senzhongii]QNL95769.1 DUF1269 domain-containing protein [Aeromicrobium senzhongii]
MAQSTLTVWKFNTPEGAEEAERTLQDLSKQNVLNLLDAATVSWPEGKKKPKTKQLYSTTGVGALGGAFWGLLFGIIFFLPVIGAAVGMAAGALAGALTDVGIDDDFIKKVRDKVTPGTSALFVLTSDVVLDKVKDAFASHEPEDLLFTNLSSDQEAALREAFGTE